MRMAFVFSYNHMVLSAPTWRTVTWPSDEDRCDTRQSWLSAPQVEDSTHGMGAMSAVRPASKPVAPSGPRVWYICQVSAKRLGRIKAYWEGKERETSGVKAPEQGISGKRRRSILGIGAEEAKDAGEDVDRLVCQ